MQNLSHVFFRLGYPRLSPSEQLHLFPHVLYSMGRLLNRVHIPTCQMLRQRLPPLRQYPHSFSRKWTRRSACCCSFHCHLLSPRRPSARALWAHLSRSVLVTSSPLPPPPPPSLPLLPPPAAPSLGDSRPAREQSVPRERPTRFTGSRSRRAQRRRALDRRDARLPHVMRARGRAARSTPPARAPARRPPHAVQRGGQVRRSTCFVCEL